MESPKKAEFHGDFSKYMFGKLRIGVCCLPMPMPLWSSVQAPATGEATPAVKEKEGELKTWTAKPTAACHLPI